MCAAVHALRYLGMEGSGHKCQQMEEVERGKGEVWYSKLNCQLFKFRKCRSYYAVKPSSQSTAESEYEVVGFKDSPDFCLTKGHRR